MKALKKYFSDSIGEIQKVVWPTKPELVQISIAVIVLGSLFTLFIGIFDFLFSYGYKLLLAI